VRLGLIGFGNVGKDFARLLVGSNSIHCVVAIIASRGGVMGNGVGNCMDRDEIMNYVNKGIYNGTGGINIDDLISANIDVAVVSIPPNYGSGEPNLGIYRKLLSNGISIITADKTGLALDFSGLLKLANDNDAQIRYRATVMAGTPAIDLVRGLRGRSVRDIKAVLNATTNFVLTKIEGGSSSRDAIDLAVKGKLAEPDPRIDLDGWDAGAKLVILANELGFKSTLRDVKLTGFNVNEDDVRRAIKEGKRFKQVAWADFLKGRLTVSIIPVNNDSILASVNGNYNAIEISVGDDMITLRGPAGPSRTTAEVLMTDLMEIQAIKRSR